MAAKRLFKIGCAALHVSGGYDAKHDSENEGMPNCM
jgi:hypothetical protein